jgi:hypothetical protein
MYSTFSLVNNSKHAVLKGSWGDECDQCIDSIHIL